MDLAYSSGSHMMRLCRMDGKSLVSHKDEVEIGRKLKRVDWNERQEFLAGWSFKYIRSQKSEVRSQKSEVRSLIGSRGRVSFRMELQD